MLVAKDEISKQQYDQAVSAAEAAKATVESQKAAVAEAQQSIAAAEVAVAQARAKVAQADATVESAMTGPQQIAITEAKVTGGQAKVPQRLPLGIDLDPGQDQEHMLRPGMSATPAVRIK